MDQAANKKAAQAGRAIFRSGGMINFLGRNFVAPDLKVLHEKTVTVIPAATLGTGLEVVEVHYQGQHVTDAYNDVRVPWNKKLDRMLTECTEKQQGLYL